MDRKNDQVRRLQRIPNPRELMRARHPDLFSDARADKVPQLARAVFEYHLETLTSRKQEYEFEHFCRKIAEKEICPNLRVQTGPTGGGDSKVDSETYPVAAEIAERWWIGEPSAGAERWAFAFSAKKSWKPKLRSDVNNIIGTGRDYKRIYFFTNQFVSDKERAKEEAALLKAAGIPVHIVDRTWIVAKVYDNGHLDLAISTLGIEGAISQNMRRPGPRDIARQAELEELDTQIADQTRYQGARYQLVEDCLRSAILARGLERPRNEVESRFAQADSLAQQLNFRPQRMRIAYNRAWTTYWWYHEYPAFGRFYDELEGYLEGSNQASEVGRLVNLWLLLAPSVAAKQISRQDARIAPRRERLLELLQPIANDPARVNNALQARTSLALIKINQSYQSGTSGNLETVWADLSQIVDESAALGSYPVEQLSDLIQEIGQHMDSPGFDALYEKVVEVIRHRRSEGEAGVAYSERGVQKLRQNKPYEAIQWFGRAEELLMKEEYRAELVEALAGSSYAYERVGLLWAARNKVLAAVERSFAVLTENGEVIPPMLFASQRLAWIELQLGRVPHVLIAMGLASFAASHLKLSENRQDRYNEEVQMQEAVLGISFLNIAFDVLPAVSRLPDALERLGLTNARLALLFALGQYNAIYAEGYFPADESTEDLHRFFELWQDQSAMKDIPPHPILAEGSTSPLYSTILGSQLVLETPNDATSFGIAESLLGAIEAFLATSDEQDLLPHRERTVIRIRPCAAAHGMPEIRFSDYGYNGVPVEIIHPPELAFLTASDALNFRNWLRDSVVALLTRLFAIRDVEAWMERIAGQERAFSRALLLGDAVTLGRNVFGDQPKLRLIDWLEAEDKTYDLLRDRPWRTPQRESGRSSEPPKFGSGPPPADLIDKNQIKHTERSVLSPIDVALWDGAKWQGTLFGAAEGTPPFLGIMFENGQLGQTIFETWRERWGTEDADDSLRVTIVTGLSGRNPTHYVIAIGPNLNQLKGSGAKLFLTVSRLNRMEPTSSSNLDRFLANYRKFGRYFLVPAQMGSPPIFLQQVCLAKRHLHIRQAWEIGENDPDVMALRDDDDPIIPPMVTNPPVTKALEQIRGLRQRSRHVSRA